MEVSFELHAPAAISPESSPDHLWIGGWVEPNASLEAAKKREISDTVGNDWATLDEIESPINHEQNDS